MSEPRNLITGIILADEKLPWPGQVLSRALLSDKPEDQWYELLSLPGVEHDRKHEAVRLPISLIEMGLHPGLLQDYPMCESLQTPHGGRILREYQRRGVTFLSACTRDREGLLLCGDPGLGKTTTALHALWSMGLLDQPGVILGPANAEGTWVDEDSDAVRYYGMEVRPLQGTQVTMDSSHIIGAKHVWVNYSVLPSWAALITMRLRPRWVIFDEVHLLCNPQAGRTKAAMSLSRGSTISHRFGLTGTPMPNRRLELWAQLAVVQPRQWGTTKYAFGMSYCAGRREAHHEGGHFVFDGESRTRELRARLSGTLMRYLITRWGENLPAITHTTVPAGDKKDLGYHKYYDIEREIIGAIRARGRGKFDEKDVASVKIRALTSCISVLSTIKAPYVIDNAIETMESGAHDHIVIFTHRRESADYIAAQLQDAFAHRDDVWVFGGVTGMTPRTERKALAKLFAAAPKSIYVATLGAAGIAINDLKQGSLGLFCDLYWNPAVLLQAVGRLHREGSPHKNIEMRFFRVPNTVDDLFAETLLSKAREINNVTPEDSEGLNLCASLVPQNVGDGKNITSVSSICSKLEALDRYQAELMEGTK